MHVQFEFQILKIHAKKKKQKKIQIAKMYMQKKSRKYYFKKTDKKNQKCKKRMGPIKKYRGPISTALYKHQLKKIGDFEPYKHHF